MTRHVLDHAQLWIGDGTALDGHVVVSGDTIESVAPGRYRGDLPVTDMKGLALSPGMIDLMVLGGFDRSILRDDPLDIAREYLRLGVTSCQFCSGTLPWASMVKVAGNVTRGMQYTGDDAAAMLGYYLEGPFQHPDLTGASLRENALPPTAENVNRVLAELGGPLTMINVSPGTDGDAEAVAMLRRAGKVVSMAHSNAPAERVLRCLDAGTSVLGHVFDNNSGLLGDSGVQQPTIEHVAFTDDRVKAIHLICDGSHVHPVLVRMVLRCRGVETVCLVTDCVPRAGRPDGPYTWDDGRPFYKKGGVGRTDKHHLTGSALLLPDHLRNFVKFTGLAPHKAIRTVTLNPAASIGLDHKIGLLAPGRAADLAAWDPGLRVRRVWRRGKEVRDISDYAEISLDAA
ncbi:MAG: amidohydrolase family protein [Planctomycetes bacterium]|nr:amidohydrolase family protein [Planctomycetota bacterium]